MVSLAQVCKMHEGCMFILIERFSFRITFQTLMSASPTMEIATTTVITQLEATLVPATMATNLATMDTNVKVGYVKVSP